MPPRRPLRGPGSTSPLLVEGGACRPGFLPSLSEGPGRDLERESDGMPEGMEAVPTGDRFGHRLTMPSVSRPIAGSIFCWGRCLRAPPYFFSPPWRPYKQIEGKREASTILSLLSHPADVCSFTLRGLYLFIGPGTAISAGRGPAPCLSGNLLTKLEGVILGQDASPPQNRRRIVSGAMFGGCPHPPRFPRLPPFASGHRPVPPWRRAFPGSRQRARARNKGGPRSRPAPACRLDVGSLSRDSLVITELRVDPLSSS